MDRDNREAECEAAADAGTDTFGPGKNMHA